MAARSIPGGSFSERLAAVHARFAKAAVSVYVAGAAIAVGLFVTTLVTDRAHEQAQLRQGLLVETDLRAHSLAQHLGLLVEELRRLGLRSEVNLVDENLAPEQSLLQLSHERSTFFNVGVAILDRQGALMWAEPQRFLPQGTSFADEPWFENTRADRTLHIVPVQPNREDALLYVVSPIVRGGAFQGALLGAIDLAKGRASLEAAQTDNLVVLATKDGTVVYPPSPPIFAREASWKQLFSDRHPEPAISTATLEGVTSIVASAPVANTDLILLGVAGQARLFRATDERFETRLTLGVVVAVLPFFVLVLLLRRSFRVLRLREEDAVREDRLRLLGEASNAIAHEVKNALNGLKMGFDLVVRKDERQGATERRDRVVGELRKEIQRLTDFTTELMTFSKGIEPRRARLDLVEFLPKVVAISKDAAAENGAEVDLVMPDEPVVVSADSALVHVVVSNLVANALDAVSVAHGPGTPRVEVALEVADGRARVRVRDNGPGVSESMRPRLFEPFQSEKPNGVGIGLALSRKIARAHGGDLELEDAGEGGGASLVCTLPLEAA